MNVFLDTNILIDVIENREGTIMAKRILQLGKDKKINIFASYLSYANINYIKRDVERTLRYNMIRRLRHGVTVLSCNAV
jgi:predicted nucleic acid-binding protein